MLDLKTVSELDLDFDAMKKLAVKNLNGMLGNLKVTKHQSGIYILQLDGNYESSLLAMDALWNPKAAFPVNGDAVVFIPTRDVLLLAGSNDRKALAEARKITSSVVKGGHHTIPDKAFRRRGGQWVVRK